MKSHIKLIFSIFFILMAASTVSYGYQQSASVTQATKSTNIKKLQYLVEKKERNAGYEPKSIYFVEENALMMLHMILLIGGVVTLVVGITISYKKKALTKLIEEDGLTGVCTTHKFQKEATKILEKANPYEYTLVILDIDNFKYINEAYGYEKGSEVLKKFSEQLSRCFMGAKLIGRVAADKFVILTTYLENVQKLCEGSQEDSCYKILFKELLGEDYNLYVSRGVYTVEDPKLDLTYMIDCANTARRLGKNIYGNTTIIFTKEMEKQRIFKNKIITHMEKALIHREFKLCYQPKIDLGTREIIGIEALVRWVPDQSIPIYPDEFIPLFEKNGFISKLDYYVFEEVCAFIKQHNEEKNVPPIAINFSAITLLKDNLIQTLKKIIDKYAISPEKIEIEVTESAIMDNTTNMIQQIEKLKAIGFTIALDDFGSGLSSLHRLKDLQVDSLKLDRGFLSDTLNGDRGIAIIENIIKMGKQLQLIIVAEGVETSEQVELLSQLQCEIAQGYHFAKPMFEKDLLSYISNQAK